MAALREQNGDSASLKLLAQSGTLAVVTGQQVGLFSGPAYTIYKALTAARMAAEMTEHGTPAVPVFWLASEDHDFPEVAHTWVYDGDHQPVRLNVEAQRQDAQPVGTVVVQDWPVAELRKTLGELPYADEVCRLVENSYTPGTTMGAAFLSLVQKLLEPYGFLYLDPLSPSIRSIAAPLLRESLSRSSELNAALLERNKELEAEGYHAQVHVDARTSLLFVIENGRRLSLRESAFTSERAVEEAAQLSPNAILRPVMQDYLLPTAAYIGGPAEVAYFAQSQVLYERLLGRMPRIVSRSGFTLIPPRVGKGLERYRLHMSDFFQGEAELQERLAAALIPPSLDAEFAKAEQGAQHLLGALTGAVTSFDSTLGPALTKSRAKMMYQLRKLHGKVARETLRRQARSQADAAYLYGSLYPEKHLQERLYSMLPFLAEHGLDLIPTLYDNVRLDCPDHILLPIT